jgi:hypothetical protein
MGRSATELFCLPSPILTTDNKLTVWWYSGRIKQTEHTLKIWNYLFQNAQTASGAHPAFYSTGTAFLYRCYSDRAAKLSTHLHLVPSLQTSGVIHLLPYMPSWRGQGKFYLHQLATSLVGNMCWPNCTSAVNNSDIERNFVRQLFIYSVSLGAMNCSPTQHYFSTTLCKRRVKIKLQPNFPLLKVTVKWTYLLSEDNTQDIGQSNPFFWNMTPRHWVIGSPRITQRIRPRNSMFF